MPGLQAQDAMAQGRLPGLSDDGQPQGKGRLIKWSAHALAFPAIAARTHSATNVEKEQWLGKGNSIFENCTNRGPEPVTERALNRVIRFLQNLPVEVTTPQGKKLIFETPEEAAKYLPIEVECLRQVLIGIVDQTNGYKARYFRERPY